MEADQLAQNLKQDGLVGRPVQPKTEMKRRKNHRRSSRNPAVLTQWIKEHGELDRPSKEEKILLGRLAHMTHHQVCDWFSNTRRVIRQISLPVWLKKHPTHSADPNLRPHIQRIFGETMACTPPPPPPPLPTQHYFYLLTFIDLFPL